MLILQSSQCCQLLRQEPTAPRPKPAKPSARPGSTKQQEHAPSEPKRCSFSADSSGKAQINPKAQVRSFFLVSLGGGFSVGGLESIKSNHGGQPGQVVAHSFGSTEAKVLVPSIPPFRGKRQGKSCREQVVAKEQQADNADGFSPIDPIVTAELLRLASSEDLLQGKADLLARNLPGRATVVVTTVLDDSIISPIAVAYACQCYYRCSFSGRFAVVCKLLQDVVSEPDSLFRERPPRRDYQTLLHQCVHGHFKSGQLLGGLETKKGVHDAREDSLARLITLSEIVWALCPEQNQVNVLQGLGKQ